MAGIQHQIKTRIKEEKPRAVLFFFVTVFFWFSNYAYVPNMTPYLKSINIGYVMIGLIGGAYGFAQMLLRVPLGLLSDRIGKRKIFVIVGLLLGTASSFLFCVTTNGVVILILRFMSGMSASAWVIYTVLFASYHSERKTASMLSVLDLASTFGIMSAKLSGSIIVSAAGYNSAFMLSGAVGLVGLILSFFVTENIPLQKEKPTLKKLLGVVKNRNLLVMAVLAVFSQMLLFATTNTFTPEAASQLGAGAVELGLLATLSSIPGVLCSMACGWLFARKVNLRAIVSVSFMLQITGTLMIPFAPNVTVIYIASIIAGFGFGACMTSALSSCTLTVDPGQRSSAMGFFQAIYGMGMFTGPVIFGAVADAFGMAQGFILSAGIALIGLILALTLIGKSKTDATFS